MRAVRSVARGAAAVPAVVVQLVADAGHRQLGDDVPVLRRVGLGCPDDPRPIGEEDSVHFGEALVELAQVHDRLPRVPILDTFAEPEAPRVGLQNVEIAVLSGLDRGGDAPGDGVLLSEMFALLNANRLGEEEAGEREDGEHEHDHGCIDRA